MVALLQENTQPIPMNRQQLMGIQTPSATLSWSPLPHHELLEKVEDRLIDHGLRIHNTRHTTSHENNRYFGTVELYSEQGRDYRRMVGIRNSHDKRYSASIIAGARVICCANGMFTGELLCLARKHTSRLHEDLDQRLDESFERLLEEWALNDRRIVLYKDTKINDQEAHDLIIRCRRQWSHCPLGGAQGSPRMENALASGIPPKECLEPSQRRHRNIEGEGPAHS